MAFQPTFIMADGAPVISGRAGKLTNHTNNPLCEPEETPWLTQSLGMIKQAGVKTPQ
jgi:hypothetical protein